jgi:DNA-3-methyladenine glycosylase
LRAVEPVAGIDAMRERRRGRPQLADGPAKLCQAFGIGPEQNGADLCRGSDLGLFDDGTPPPSVPVVGPRIGISKAVELPWRFRVPRPA